MSKRNLTFKSIVTGVILSFYTALPAIAEDIEIYTSLSSANVTVKPNVLFVLDTSGSMNSRVTVASAPYDPNITYSGCYGSGRIYYSSSGSTPSCWTGSYFWDSSLHCDHAWDEYDATGSKLGPTGPIESAGFYTGQVAQKRSNNVWNSIRVRNSSDRNRPIECNQDQGIHGSNSSPTPNTYITNSSNGWTSSVTNPSVWSGSQNNYTLYHWNYLNYLVDPGYNTSSTRFIEMQTAIKNIVDASSNINIALMHFDGSSGNGGIEGGPIIYAMEDVNTGRTGLKNAVDALSANSSTPLAETYFEALKYFGGSNVHFGANSSPTSVNTAKTSPSSGTYKSPISDTCQQNHIIYLTDGAPSGDNLSTSELSTLPGFVPSVCASSSTPSILNSCLKPLAEWAFNYDVANVASEPGHNGRQLITTHTIGFDFSNSSPSMRKAEQLLRETADVGGGQFYPAADAGSLVNAFNQIIAEILAVNTTFSSPAVSVNAFNRSTHLDDLYFTLFKPAKGAHWDGNLKKYKIAFGPDVDDMDFDSDTNEELPFISDATGNNAIDRDSGFFKTTAHSYWSASADGDVVALGGSAGELTNTRNVYTLTGGYTDTNGVNVPDDGDLTATQNALDKANAALTDVMLNVDTKAPVIGTTPYRDTLLDFSVGIDVFDDDGDGSTTDERTIIGDPLHAEPALIQYGEVSGNPDLVAYVATNDGYLHAVNTIDGTEYFSFVPQEKLTNLDVVMENDGTLGKSYGLDGNVVPWINDKDKNGMIDSGEHVYLYFGMRRGGNDIISMDVTNRNKPELRWVIKGGTGNFTELAQTWSTINVEDMEINGSSKKVLIFGGGYDTNQDVVSIRTSDAQGRAIYIVDAETGARLWWAGPTGSGADVELVDMNYSIPSRIKPLDVNGDGFIDRLYTGDMGGQLWRFDIVDDDLSNITGGRIADLGKDNDINDTRRFYYPPDVSLILEEGSAPYLAILAASGYRAHPLNEDIHDRMYMIKDYDIYSAPASYTTLTESDLYDTTLNVIGEGSEAQVSSAASLLQAADGWYITFNEAGDAFIGEKSLSEPLILAGVGIVTTFIPQDIIGSAVASCTPREGTGSVFFINITDGTPTYNFAGTTDLQREDRKNFLKRGGIPPSPNIIITEEGIAQCIGTECHKSLEINNIQKTYWYEQEQR